LSEDHEAVGIRLHHLVEDALKLFSPHACQNDDFFDIGLIHAFYDVGWRDLSAVNSRGVIDVIVDVDDVELCARHLVRGRVQHGLWIPILQQQGHTLFGVRIFTILNVLREGRSVIGGQHGGECRNVSQASLPAQFVGHSLPPVGELRSCCGKCARRV
jgi:hypothetical protein